MAKTGVKFVHAAAHDNFDIGIYFEANGHGTVLFSKIFYECLSRCESFFSQSLSRGKRIDPRNLVALTRLQLLPALVNQAVGDALSDLLLVECILHLRRADAKAGEEISWNRDFQVWNNLYNELPSRQLKVKVRDRLLVKTNENETKAISPHDLQPALDKAVHSINERSPNQVARCFVRPSGTENAVRVYAEANTLKLANLLAEEAVAILEATCNGSSTYKRNSKL